MSPPATATVIANGFMLVMMLLMNRCMTHANLQWDNLETGVPRTRGYARDKKTAKLYILETNMYCIQFGFFQINKDESWICLFVFQIEATGGQPCRGRRMTRSQWRPSRTPRPLPVCQKRSIAIFGKKHSFDYRDENKSCSACQG